MEGVVCKNQAGALRPGQAAFDEGQITFLVAAVNLVADDGMAEVREVDAELVFAAGAGNEAEQGKRGWRIKTARRDARPTNGGNKPVLDEKIRLRGRAIGADAILDGDAAVFVPAERGVNGPLLRRHVAVDNGEVFLRDRAALEHFSQLAGGPGIFRDQNHAAGFAVKAVDEKRPRAEG
jgi:hypothetical protein